MFLRSFLPGPSAMVLTLACGALSGEGSGRLTGGVLAGSFIACLVSIGGYWSAFSRHHPGEVLPRIPLAEPEHPDISKWALRCGGWTLGLVLSFVLLFAYFQICTYLKFHS